MEISEGTSRVTEGLSEREKEVEENASLQPLEGNQANGPLKNKGCAKKKGDW